MRPRSSLSRAGLRTLTGPARPAEAERATTGFSDLGLGNHVLGIVMVVTGGNPPRPGGPWKAQAISLVAMTAPFALYFALGEASRWRGTLGKHLVGLVVHRRSEQRLSIGRALLRNAIKFVPWEFGQTVAHQAIYSSDGGFPLWDPVTSNKRVVSHRAPASRVTPRAGAGPIAHQPRTRVCRTGPESHLSPDFTSHANGVLATEEILEAHTASFVAVCVPGAVDEYCPTP